MCYFMHLFNSVIVIWFSPSFRESLELIESAFLLFLHWANHKACFARETGERRNLSYGGKEKMRSIPGSIYLPRKHFPTKQKYQQEKAERDNPEDSLRAHKKNNWSFKRRNAMFISHPGILVDCGTVFTFRGRKGTLHAGVMNKGCTKWEWDGADISEGCRQEAVQDSSRAVLLKVWSAP